MGVYFAKKRFTVVFFSSVLWRDFMSAHVLWYEEVEDDCKYKQPDVIDHSVRSDRAVSYATH